MKTKHQSGHALSIIIVVFTLFIAGAVGTVFFSRNAKPGDPLYNIRVLNEGIQYALTPSAIAKAELALKNSQIVADQIKEAASQPSANADHIKAGAAVLVGDVKQATEAAKQAKPASYTVSSIPSAKATATQTGIAKPVVTGGADSTKYADLVANLINNTQNATVTLQQAAITVPSSAPNAKVNIQKLQANLQQQVAALRTSSGGNTTSGSSSSSSSSSCFSSITTQVNGQPPVSQSSASCNSVLTSSGSTSYTGGSVTPPPVTSPSPGSSSSSSSCHSISTQTINGVTSTQESFSCNATIIQTSH